MKSGSSKKQKVASGEGERRAMRGYIPQYDLGARLLYEALASGELQWVGIADRTAGSFDDIVLGLFDRIEAYQVKTSKTPAGFSISTLLLGAPAVLADMVVSAKKLWTEFGDKTVETIFACDDFPYDNDNLGDEPGHSSAAFLRLHAANRKLWALEEWAQSPFSKFISKLRDGADLDEMAFLRLLQNIRFVTGGVGRRLGFSGQLTQDIIRMGEVAALLPRLISTGIEKDRWSVSELLTNLKWHNPFELRHSHVFPVDALYQNNQRTQDDIMRTLAEHTTGYISLLGPPGSGKSTALATGLLPISKASILRYTAFVPGEGQGLGRAEAYDFLHDLIKQFKEQDIGRALFVGTEISELRVQFQQVLKEAGQRFKETGIRSIIVIDGLDHVPREERPQLSFLTVLPLPQSVPLGVLFLLGSQRLDFSEIPPAVTEQATEVGRQIDISPLSREEVSRLIDLALTPEDVDRGLVFERSEGHPLSVRYLIAGLLNTLTVEERGACLRDGPTYGGDVNVFYQRAWRDISQSADATRGMAYLALIDGPISLQSMDTLIGNSATDAVMSASKHLLRQGRDEAWSIFHNSFRLFLREKAGVRHGTKDEATIKARYVELAVMAAKAPVFDQQRWLELRYRARADDHEAVAALAKARRFRSDFISGRDPTEIRADLDFAMRSAGILRRADMVLELILARHEVNRRSEAFGDAIFDAWVELGDLDRARALVDADITLSIPKGYELVDAYLEVGDGVSAREVFESIEPVDQLLGAEVLKVRDHERDTTHWAKRVLAFRTSQQFLSTISRLQKPRDIFEPFNLNDYRRRLKILAARGQLERNYELVTSSLAAELELPKADLPFLNYFAGASAFAADDQLAAVAAFERLVKNKGKIPFNLRSDAGAICAKLGRLDLAANLADGVVVPTFARFENNYSFDWLKGAAEEAFQHAELLAWLDIEIAASCSSANLLSKLENRIVSLGRMTGTIKAGRRTSGDVQSDLKSYIDFLRYAESEDSLGADRMKIDRAIPALVEIAVALAWVSGADNFLWFIQYMDRILQNDAGRLGSGAARRAFAVAVFRRDYNAQVADTRITYMPGSQDTPDEQLSEAAETAKALTQIGSHGRARRLLHEMHDEGLGWAREAKKDPQYIMWGEFFKNANAEDRGGASDRLAFLGRLLAGMAQTKGNQAAGRLAVEYLRDAAQTSTSWAIAARDHLHENGLADWVDQVTGLTLGVSERNAKYTLAAALIYGRLALPYADDHSPNILPKYLKFAPKSQQALLCKIAAEWLATDCRQSKRVQYLTQLVDAAQKAGITFETDPVARWRTELPPARSGNSPEDPFFLAPSLSAVADIYKTLDNESSKYGVVRAFVHHAEIEGYASMIAFLEQVPSVLDEERGLEVAAEIAAAAGNLDKAGAYLNRLEVIARDKGAWGDSFSGAAKRRYFRVKALVFGEPAREEAFDAFVDDMANRREYVDYMLSGLSDVMEVLSPRPSWATAWEVLQAQLREFRDYKIGVEVAERPTVEDSYARTLAELLLVGMRSNAISLVNLIRITCSELLQVPYGDTVVASLTSELISADDLGLLEAMQIAWDCRDSGVVRAAVEPQLGRLSNSSDFAVSQVALELADHWGILLAVPFKPLSLAYTIKLPTNPKYYEFKSPSGISDFFGGLYTDDILTWTWPLARPIRMTSKATGIDIANLRTRAGAILTKAGGLEAFGSNAVKEQNSTLHRLRLHIGYRKVSSVYAFRAMRQVLSEIVNAQAINPEDLIFISPHTGAYASVLAPTPPQVRPIFMPPVEIPNDFYKKDEWLADASQDILCLAPSSVVVLAAICRYRVGLWADERVVEQYWGVDYQKPPGKGIYDYLHAAPSVLISDAIVPLYGDEISPGGIVFSHVGLAEALNSNAPLLCPILAESVGWTMQNHNPLIWIDQTERVVAQTIYWRDGGIHSHETDHDTAGEGYLLWVEKDELPKLRPALSGQYISICYRIDRNKKKEEERLQVSTKAITNPY